MMVKGFRGSIWLTFQSPGKILEVARKGEAWGTLENRRAPERAIEAGRGGCT